MSKLSHKYRIRRVNNPIVEMSPLPSSPENDPMKDTSISNDDIAQKPHSKEKTTPKYSDQEQMIINHHLYNTSEDTTVDAVFNMQSEPINQSIRARSTLSSNITTNSNTITRRQRKRLTPKGTYVATTHATTIDWPPQHKPPGKHIHELGNKTVQIQHINQQLSIDPGDTATMQLRRRNTMPSTKPEKYSDIWHADIGFGPCAAIGGIHYTLMLVDKFSRFKFVYGLKNLTSSLLSAMKQFVIDAGIKPTKIRTDFDQKIIGGKVKSFLQDNVIDIQASPPYRQHQNGLVERHWKTVVSMARNWLTSNLLPSKYWYFAVKRACEVLNIMPITHNDKVTTPFELVYRKKVDY
jgi:transposase InsO family protein